MASERLALQGELQTGLRECSEGSSQNQYSADCTTFIGTLHNRPHFCALQVEAAFRGPVDITRRGKRKFVLLTAEEYDRLVKAADTRRAFHADDVPEDVAAVMLQALAGDHDES